jgi:hypothetical protein
MAERTERPQVLLHMGMPKTGTSLLQHCASRLAASSSDTRLYYPETGRRGVAHHVLAGAVKTPEAWDVRRELLAEVQRAHLARNRRVALISSEAFSNVIGINIAPGLLRFLEPLRNAWSLGPVLVVRELSEFLESMFLQSARFGHLDMTFAQYVASRRRWISDLMAGVALIRASFGDQMTIVHQRPGFEVLGCFEGLLQLRTGELLEHRAAAPVTRKETLKTQIVLSRQAEVEALIGRRLSDKTIRSLSARGRLFQNDVEDYTLYAPGEAERVWKEAMEAARLAGLSEYVEAFQDWKPADKASVSMRLDILEAEDLDRLREIGRLITASAE